MFEWDEATKVSEVVQGWETWEGKKVNFGDMVQM